METQTNNVFKLVKFDESEYGEGTGYSIMHSYKSVLSGDDYTEEVGSVLKRELDNHYILERVKLISTGSCTAHPDFSTFAILDLGQDEEANKKMLSKAKEIYFEYIQNNSLNDCEKKLNSELEELVGSLA